MPAAAAVLRWDRHTLFTEPGAHRAAVAALPRQPGALADIVRGVLLHVDFLQLYGLTAAHLARVSRRTLPVADRLDRVLALDDAPLTRPREPVRRSVGTCRDYALLLCSLLRTQAVPARLRCGFAAYLGGDRHEDHWVCEYWHDAERRWALADAQLDGPHRAALGIAFDTVDLPDGAFLPAHRAWQLCRAGDAGEERFGHGDAAGCWFLRVNLARDLLALTRREVSAWDGWRELPQAARSLDLAAVAWCDHRARLAARLAAAPPEPPPAAPSADFAPAPWWP